MTASPAPKPQAGSFLWALAFMGAIAAYCNDALLPIIPLLEGEFSIGASRSQFIFTVGLLGYTIFQIPMGFLSDRYGRRPVGLVAGLVLISATLMAIFATSFSVLLLSRFCMGAAMAYGPILSRAIIRDLSSAKSSLVGGLSVLTIFLAAATVLAPFLTNFLTPYFGWQSAFVNCLFVVTLVWFLLLFLIPETLVKSEMGSAWGARFKTSLGVFVRSPDTVAGTIFFTLYFVGYFSILTNLASILVDEFGRSPHLFARVFACIAIANTLGAVVCRRLSKTLPDKHLVLCAVIVAIAVALASIVLMTVWPYAPLSVFVAIMTLYGLGLGLIVPAATSLALKPMGEAAGFASAFMGTVQTGVATLGSAIAAAIYTGSKTSLLGILVICAVLLSVSFFTYNRLKRNQRRAAQMMAG